MKHNYNDKPMEPKLAAGDLFFIAGQADFLYLCLPITKNISTLFIQYWENVGHLNVKDYLVDNGAKFIAFGRGALYSKYNQEPAGQARIKII
jgi:hypothetical protein